MTLKITKFSWDCIINPPLLQDCTTVSGTNNTYLPISCFAQILPCMQWYFCQSLINVDCFTCGIGAEFLTCLKVALYYLFGQPGFYLTFILNKKKRFSAGASLRMPPLSTSKYSKINQFKIRKDLSFQK